MPVVIMLTVSLNKPAELAVTVATPGVSVMDSTYIIATPPEFDISTVSGKCDPSEAESTKVPSPEMSKVISFGALLTRPPLESTNFAVTVEVLVPSASILIGEALSSILTTPRVTIIVITSIMVPPSLGNSTEASIVTSPCSGNPYSSLLLEGVKIV
ncbi:hypothetical protein ES705_41728 [subsurface metagenome]